ncbi:Uncharacterised protein [Nocardia otitidiscaviarum]|uniref:Uncharacterized protein n=2 Tax=Nocardia otitidiscaviarum TaxID=1823 RepID=A0A378Y8C2_9NOCA|nr:hypothetical protein [Nocardia otitidiscaviarum]MBF6241570.1 hypothetical protein [Nocardia otitidiscaviarum]SUA72800.1 Uncharacterised protein [Nocardia otitidiscaviarum]
MAMTYNYQAVDTSTLTFQQIVGAIEENNQSLMGLENGLKASFTGEAAENGWHPQIDLLLKKIGEYNAALQSLKTAIMTAGGAGGLMNTTDKDAGSRFLAIGI